MSWRRAVTRGSLLVMESVWVYCMIAVFVAYWTDGGKPSFLATFLVVAASFSLSRLLQGSDLAVGVIRAWGVALSFLIFYAIVRADFFGDWRFWDFGFSNHLFNATEATVRDQAAAFVGIPLLWLFWIRGVLRGQEYLGFEGVTQTFAFGLLMMLATQLLQLGIEDEPPLVRQLAVPYVAIGLLAIALAHASRSQDSFGQTFTPGWLLAASGAIAVLGGLALAVTIFDFGGASDATGEGLRTVGLVAGRVFAIIVWPFLWVTAQFFQGIQWLAIKLFGEPNPNLFREPPAQGEEEESGPARELPAWLNLLIRTLVGGSVIGVLLLVTAILFTRYRRRPAPDEVTESTYSDGRLAADLGEMLSGLLSRLRPNLHLHRDQSEPVRRLYFDLLRDGVKRGVERQRAQTPLELAPRLAATYSSQTPTRITDVFDATRYGGVVPPAEDIERLRHELEDLQKQP